MRERDEHYSNRGGHRERSEFWKDIRRVAKNLTYSPTKELRWLIRRDMQRVPRDGKN